MQSQTPGQPQMSNTVPKKEAHRTDRGLNHISCSYN